MVGGAENGNEFSSRRNSNPLSNPRGGRGFSDITVF